MKNLRVLMFSCVTCWFLLAFLLAPKPGAELPSLPIVKIGGQKVTGIVLSATGVIAVPALASSAPDNCTVTLDGQEYPAKILADDTDYGLLLLKIERQKPLAAPPLENRMIATSTKLRLVGLAPDGTLTEQPVAKWKPRHHLTEPHLTGSFYEITLSGEAPAAGAVLQNAETGLVYGLLVAPAGSNGTRYVLRTETICDRATNLQGIAMGNPVPVKQPQIQFSDKHNAPAQFGLLPFSTDSGGEQGSTLRARAVQDMRKYTGFQVNRLTTPEQDGSRFFFGASNGNLYSVDSKDMQKVWIFDNENAIFYPPVVAGDFVCFSAGNLGFEASVSQDASLGNLIVTGLIRDVPVNIGSLAGNLFQIKTVHRYMLDYGNVKVVDRSTGAIKWTYPRLWLTRFLSQPQIVGDKVLVGGVNTLAVLSLADGKPLWEYSSDKREGNPIFYVVAGGSEDKMWTLKITGRLDGEYTLQNPMRLEQAAQSPEVECYRIPKKKGEERKMLWHTPISMPRGAPALSATMIMSPDHKICYGATARDVFAVDAETGKLLWQKKHLFAPGYDEKHPGAMPHFDGNLTYSDSLLFATGSDNKLYALNAQNGDTLWMFNDCTNILCAPLAYQGKVYIGSHDTNLYALDALTGKWVWKFETTGKICGQPRILNGKVYCATDDGRLTELTLPE